MTTLMLETEPLAAQVRVTEEKLIVELVDGRSLSVPLAWYPRLTHASQEERQNWQLLGDGYAIEWVDLDEHIGIEGLLAGRSSGEIDTALQRQGDRSLQRWLATRPMPPKT